MFATGHLLHQDSTKVDHPRPHARAVGQAVADPQVAGYSRRTAESVVVSAVVESATSTPGFGGWVRKGARGDLPFG